MFLIPLTYINLFIINDEYRKTGEIIFFVLSTFLPLTSR